MLVSLVLALYALTSLPTLDDVPTLAKAALEGDRIAVTRLRALGPPGLDALVKLRRELSSVPPLFFGPPSREVLTWEQLVDEVARQRHASASGLYWYTDLAEAQAVARREGRPILSLRLLGDLDEDLSCANSRFFRTILYPDPAIARALHDGWVLHWESVRKAPVIRIDFGDGRVLTRTITGNSLHYALTPDGEVADVLPGMVGPEAFRAWLDAAAEVVAEVSPLTPDARRAAIFAHLERDLGQRLEAWQAALAAIGVDRPRTLTALAAAMTDETLDRLAARERIRLSDEAAALVGPMMTTGDGRLALLAMPLAVTKAAVERPMLRLLAPVTAQLAKDQVRNTLEMKSRVLAIALEEHANLHALTSAIYARAFLTPLDDPWMGLAPPDVFTGLPPSVEKSASR